LNQVRDVQPGPNGTYIALAAESNKANRVIVSIDPATGNRKTLFDGGMTECGTVKAMFDHMSGLAVAPDGAMYLALNNMPQSSGKGIARLTPDGKCSVVTLSGASVAANNKGSGPDMIGTFLYNVTYRNNLLYVLQFNTHSSILQIDPKTGNRTMITVNPDKGTGPDVGTDSMAISPAGTFWTYHAYRNGVYGLVDVDPATGNRTKHEPKGGPAKRAQGPDRGIYVHPDGKRVLFQYANSIIVYDPSTRTATRSPTERRSPKRRSRAACLASIASPEAPRWRTRRKRRMLIKKIKVFGGILFSLGITVSFACESSFSDDPPRVTAHQPPPDGGVSTPSPPRIIGPQGGVIQGPEGSSVRVPAGALASDTAITVRVADAGEYPSPPTGSTFGSKVYSFEPHGLVFSSPAVVSIPMNSGVSAAGLTGLHAPPGGAWTRVQTAPGTGGAEISTSSFSFFGLASLPDSGVPPSGACSGRGPDETAPTGTLSNLSGNLRDYAQVSMSTMVDGYAYQRYGALYISFTPYAKACGYLRKNLRAPGKAWVRGMTCRRHG